MVTVSQFPKHDVTPPPQKTIFHNEDIGDLVVFDGFFNCHVPLSNRPFSCHFKLTMESPQITLLRRYPF